MKKSIMLLCATFFFVTGLHMANAGPVEMIRNGDFSEGFTGWSVSNPYGHSAGIVPADMDGPGGLDVSEAFRCQPGSGNGLFSVQISQSVSLTAGVEYSLSADLAASFHSDSHPANASGGEITAYIDGKEAVSLNFGQIFQNSWKYEALFETFIADSSGLFEISFFRPYLASTQTPFTYVDNISLTYQQSPVPEPGTIVTLGLGLVFAARVARKRS